MKIGICTCYDNHNYGSMLQAYATYVKFVELGYDCEFLCYRKKLNTIQKIKWLPRLLNKYLMKEKFRLIEKKIQLKKHPDIKMKDAIRQRAFDRFLENFLKDKVSAPYIGFEALRAGSKNYDVVVAGGDQLWIPAGLPTNFFNLMFADEKVKRVSYSTSFGVTEVPFYQKRRTIEYLNRIEIGTTSILCHSDKGKKLLEQPDVIDKMRIKSVDSEELILTEGSMLIASAKKSENREAFFHDRELMTYEQLTNKYAPITLKMIIGDIVKRSLRYTGPIGKAVILYNKKKSIEKYQREFMGRSGENETAD